METGGNELGIMANSLQVAPKTAQHFMRLPDCGFSRNDIAAVGHAESRQNVARQTQSRQNSPPMPTPATVLLDRKVRANTC